MRKPTMFRSALASDLKTIRLLPILCVCLALSFLVWLLLKIDIADILRNWVHFLPPRGTNVPITNNRPGFILISIATVDARAQLYLPQTLPHIINQTILAPILITITKVEDPLKLLQALAFFGPFVEGYSGKDLTRLSVKREGRKVFESTSTRIVLQILEKDWGPGTKLVGAYSVLGPKPDAAIVTLDDDCLYPPDQAEVLVTHLPLDKGAVSGRCEEYGGGWLRKPGDWVQPVFVQLHLKIWRGKMTECKGWLMGVTGAAFWASTLDDSLFTFLDTLPPGCFYHDDVWLSGFLHSKGIKRYLYYGIKKAQHLTKLPFSMSEIKGTQINFQLPCIKAFDYFGMHE